MHTFSGWFATPGNRPAFLAVQRVAEGVTGKRRRPAAPLFLHGPAGVGKTHLINALVADATRRRPDLVAAVLAANDLALLLRPGDDGSPSPTRGAAVGADLLAI